MRKTAFSLRGRGLLALALLGLALAACATPPLSPEEQSRVFGPAPPAPTAEQLASAPNAIDVIWLSRPTGVDYVTVWPRNGWRDEIEVTVMLDCLVQPDGTAACAALDDKLPQYDYEQAARMLSTLFVLSTTDRAGASNVGHRFRVPVAFRFAN